MESAGSQKRQMLRYDCEKRDSGSEVAFPEGRNNGTYGLTDAGVPKESRFPREWNYRYGERRMLGGLSAK